MWRPLAMRRKGQVLLVAVEWNPRTQRNPHTYSVVAVSLDATALRWHDVPNATAARQALRNASRPGARQTHAGEG